MNSAQLPEFSFSEQVFTGWLNRAFAVALHDLQATEPGAVLYLTTTNSGQRTLAAIGAALAATISVGMADKALMLLLSDRDEFKGRCWGIDQHGLHSFDLTPPPPEERQAGLDLVVE